MSTGWPSKPLGECVRHRSEFIRLDDRETYLRCRVQLNGRGIVLRDRVQGVDVKTKDQQVCRAGELLVAEIDAKMGGVGIVPEELNGSIVSSHYFLFEIDESTLRRKFLDYYVRTPGFQTQVKARGSTNYSAIRPYHVLAYTIPLPSPEEQDRVVATLDAAAARVAEARQLCREIDEEADALCRSILSDPRYATTPTPMRELVIPRAPDVEVKAQESYHFAGIYCFGKGMFRGQTRLGAEFSYDILSRVRAGEFTYPKLMAWEGALCVVPPECDGLYVSTEYPVFEINTERVLPDVLDVYFRSPEVWPKLSGTSNGTNVRRRRLNPQQFLNYIMPLPERRVQERVAKVRAKLAGIKAQHAGLVSELEALMPAILDRAFKGELVGSGRMSTASTVAVDGSPVAVAGATRVVKPSSAPVEGSTGTVEGSTPVVKGSNMNLEGSSEATGRAVAAVAGASAGGSQVGSAESARSRPSSVGQTWNIPEIAAIQAELVRRNGGSATLGRKKISKGAYLAAALLGAKQNPPPLRKAAGPFNTQGQSEVEAYAAQAGWFRDSGPASGHRSSSRYRAGDRIGEAAAKTKGLVAARAAEFERFVGLYVNWDSDTAELHATAHAAWNGLIAAGKPVTEAAIIETFFEWSEEKAKFKAAQIRSALGMLRSLGMEPNGGGPVVAGIGEDTLFRGASR